MLTPEFYEDSIVDALSELHQLRDDFEGLVALARATPLDVAPFMEFAALLDGVVASLEALTAPAAGSPVSSTDEVANTPPPLTHVGSEDAGDE